MRNGGSIYENWAQEHMDTSCEPPQLFTLLSALLSYFCSSVQDEITGEVLAVKMVTRVFEKLQLAKRALREITLLRHFNNHENVENNFFL